jgi:transaldolase
MPEATLKAVGSVEDAMRDTITSRYEEARAIVGDIEALGIDFADVAEVLEREGIAAFAQSWDGLIACVEEQLKNAGADVMPAGAVRPASGEGAVSRAPAAAAPAETAKDRQA